MEGHVLARKICTARALYWYDFPGTERERDGYHDFAYWAEVFCDSPEHRDEEVTLEQLEQIQLATEAGQKDPEFVARCIKALKATITP